MSREFLAGRYSIADMACYPYIKLSNEAEIKLDKYNFVNEWISNVEKQHNYISFED